MSNGIFQSDAERDASILRLEERLREVQEDVREIKTDIKGLKENIEEFYAVAHQISTDSTERLQKLENRVAVLETWVKILSSIFVSVITALVVYVTQKVIP